MLLRDPVHGLMSFEGDAGEVLSALIDCRELQRLRHIRQLGWTTVAFPGAEHSRFSHSLGAGYVMALLQRQLRLTEATVPEAVRISREDAQDALAASLLHDLGHGPFSHLFEELLPSEGSHEQWTQRILRDPGTDVARRLERLRPGMALSVAALLQGNARLPYLAQSVSGTLDVDRCDYLLRDSLMTGVRYGLYDLAWLLKVLTVRPLASGEWVLAVDGEKGLPPIEGYFLGRHHMHQQVYFHRATRSAEGLVRESFARVLALLRDGGKVDPVPRAFLTAANDLAVSLGDYLALDDNQLLSCMAAWQEHPDAILSDLTRRVFQRVLYKSVVLPEALEVQAEVLARARDVLADHPLGAERAAFLDDTADCPYDEPSEGPGTIWVALRRGPVVRLSEASFLMGQLAGKVTRRTRLHVVPEGRDAVLRAIKALLPPESGAIS